MNKLLYILLFMLMAGTVSCHRTSEAEARLIAIDSLIPEAPDSALALLEAFDTASLRGEMRAYHALLTAQALYKAYIPATSDSIINCAWDYYKDHGRYDRRIRAMLYKGTTAEELGHPEEAMRWYKRTELESRPDDHYHRGYALMSMGILYQHHYSYRNAINKFRQTISCDNGHVDLDIIKYCILQLNQLYILHDLDSTYYYLDLLNDLIKSSSAKNQFYERAYSEGLLFYNYYGKEYKKAKDIGRLIIKNDSGLVNCSCWQAVSISYAKLGNRDSALYYHLHSPLPANLDDSVWFNQSEAEIRLLDGDLRNSGKFDNIADELAGIKVVSAIDNKLVTIEAKTEKEWSDAQHRHNYVVKLMSIAIVAAIALLVFCFMHWHISRKKRTELLSLQQFVEQLESQAYESKKRNDEYNVQLKNRNAEIETMQQSIEHFANTLRALLNSLQRPSKKTSKTDSELILKEVLSEPFFSFLRQYVDNAHHGLTTAMSANKQISNQDINIICMHICRIPNTIIATYTGYTSVHSVTTRKERIIKAFLGENAKISDIMNY